MWQVGEPHEHSAEKTSKHLRRDVTRDAVPRKGADGGECDRDRRVEVSSADAADGVHGNRHSHAPSERNHDPPGVLPLRTRQQHVRDDPISHKDENHWFQPPRRCTRSSRQSLSFSDRPLQWPSIRAWMSSAR